MKIVAAPIDYHGCGYYRILVPFRFLKERGHDVVFVGETGQGDLNKTVGTFVLQRSYNPDHLKFARELRGRGAKLVYELDDNFHCLPHSNPNQRDFSNGRPATRVIEQFMREADTVICSTPGLAEYYQKFRPDDRLNVCHNALDDAMLEQYAPAEITGTRKRYNEIRIGWAGSDTHRGDLASIGKPLVKIMRENPEIRVVFVGSDMRSMFPEDLRSRTELAGITAASPAEPTYDCRSKTLPTLQYYDLIASAEFDFAIVPLMHDTFNRCKSWVKVVEFGMFGVPVLASRFGPYREYLEGSLHPPIATAADEREWYAKLGMMVEDAAVRATFAKANLQYVRSEHVMSRRVVEWESALGLWEPATV